MQLQSVQVDIGIRKSLTYNLATDLINDTFACENDKMLNDVLKREYGFQGYVMSDWQAQHSTMSAVTGLDVSVQLPIPRPFADRAPQ